MSMMKTWCVQMSKLVKSLPKLLFLVCLCSAVSGAGAERYQPVYGQPGKDVMWVSSNDLLIESMFNLAVITSADTVVDLGSGDGKVVIAAARRGARAIGVEYHPQLVTYSREMASLAGLTDKTLFVEGDLFEYDFSKASVLVLFLGADINLRLRDAILSMKPGSRVISNSFGLGEWTPNLTTRIAAPCEENCIGMMWIVPGQIGGVWESSHGRIVLNQRFQQVTGYVDRSAINISGSLLGNELLLTIGDEKINARVEGDRISGRYGKDALWSARRVK